MNRRWLLALAAMLLALGAAMMPVSEDASAGRRAPRSLPMPATEGAGAPEGPALDVLFIHHSCGGQLLAPVGANQGDACIYRSHPNGGGLRDALAARGFTVNEASYGSAVGEDTDLFDWLPKFRDRMEAVLATRLQDERLPAGRRNRVVVFKSCYPNNAFAAEGEAPGDPRGPALTLWNARATLSALLPELAKRPDVLFVYVTAPPLAPARREAAWRWAARRVGLLRPLPDLGRMGDLARRFDDWVTSPDGWLAGYAGRNVAVFDYYGALADRDTGLSAFPTGGGTDSHPSAEGNARAAARFVPFLEAAVRRAGLAGEGTDAAK